MVDKMRGLGYRDWQLVERARVTARLDAQRITQAMIQLAENAVRHIADRSRIEVGSDVEEGRLRLWVADRGPGVPEAARQTVYERFDRGTGTAPGTEEQGAGPGLSIVRAIAEAHGGAAHVEHAARRRVPDQHRR